MWGYYRDSSFFKKFMIQKIGILALVFCGFFSNIIYADSVNSELNHATKNTLATSFSTNPAAVGGTVTVCQGQSITYTNTSSGVGTNPTYAWSFPGGNTTSYSTEGPHTITYNTAGTYTTIFTVNGVSSSVSVVVLNGSTPSFALGPNWGVTTFNNTTYFSRCNITNGNVNFTYSTDSQNTNSNTIHSIDWETVHK